MVRICKNSLDLLQFPNFSIYLHVVAILEKKKQRTLGVKFIKKIAKSIVHIHKQNQIKIKRKETS
jgi:hypothetical protein